MNPWVWFKENVLAVVGNKIVVILPLKSFIYWLQVIAIGVNAFTLFVPFFSIKVIGILFAVLAAWLFKTKYVKNDEIN